VQQIITGAFRIFRKDGSFRDLVKGETFEVRVHSIKVLTKGHEELIDVDKKERDRVNFLMPRYAVETDEVLTRYLPKNVPGPSTPAAPQVDVVPPAAPRMAKTQRVVQKFLSKPAGEQAINAAVLKPNWAKAILAAADKRLGRKAKGILVKIAG